MHHSHARRPALRGGLRHAQRPMINGAASRPAARVVVHAGPSDVFVLDFDGVLVDSEREVSLSALEAAKARWPQAFTSLQQQQHQHQQQQQQQPLEQGQDQEQALLEGLRKARPVLVRGYESMVMVRLLLEDPQAWQAILSEWETLLPRLLERLGEDAEELTKAFEQQRNTWLNGNTDSWLACNQPYPGVREALQQCEFPFYIASSKAAHRVAAAARGNLGIDLPQDSPRLFCSLLPPDDKKAEALRQIEQRPVCSESGARLHFIDDRLATLKAVQWAQGLGRWQLYLAAWGYCTEAERQEAARTPGIRVTTLPEFIELLKWGILMGVDDGCEPTAEEIAAGV